ncbi:MAG: hypothetical protein ACLGHN_03165 [Bacteriovoracia bacterium]
MKKVFILAALTLLGQNSWAQIREFQTTRLVSTAGAGVASILSTEAAVLNPAASAFFSGNSASYQRYNTRLQNKDAARSTDGFPDDNLSQGYFLADHSGPVKGGTAYILQDENNYERERVVLHGAAPMGKATSLGVSYSYIRDNLPRGFPKRKKIHHQTSIGFTHIVDEKTILGLVVLDPTRTTPGEERAIGGFQYSLSDRFMLIGDVGTQYTKNVSKEYLWRAAIQLNIFSDFFLKVGRFYDNITDFKGTGWGVSWIGPRFGVEFAQKYSEQFESGSYVYEEEKLVDTSFSAIIKF